MKKNHDALKKRKILHKKQAAVARRKKRILRKIEKWNALHRLIPGEIRLNSPEYFRLEDDVHDQMAIFLGRLRKAFVSSNNVCVDFKNLKKVVAGGMLLFFSEIHRLKNLFPRVSVRCFPPKDSAVVQVFRHLRVFELFGYKCKVIPTRADVVSWRYATSENIDGSAVGGVLSAYESLEGEKSRLLYRGATEAMYNAVGHAYIADREDGLPAPEKKSWWIFCKEDESNAVVAVCDLGIGIPRSLPKLYPDEIVRELLAKISRGRIPADSAMIEAAMQLSRTRTGVGSRGKGLQDTKAIVDAVPGGKLYVFSNKGMLLYQNGKYIRKDYRKSIKGTVVVWVIPIKGVEK